MVVLKNRSLVSILKVKPLFFQTESIMSVTFFFKHVENKLAENLWIIKSVNKECYFLAWLLTFHRSSKIQNCRSICHQLSGALDCPLSSRVLMESTK